MQQNADFYAMYDYLERFNEDAFIVRTISKPQGIVSSRDVIVFFTRAELSDTSACITFFTPDNYEAPPLSDGAVKARINFGLILCEALPDDPNTTKMTSIV